MNIAIYGKGGIGKSTITTNVSLLLAKQGKKVLQIGCDPKHDSTLSLIGSQKIETVISSIDSDIDEDKIILKGRCGIDCVEIGGPLPGLGCAGRGMIAGLSYVENMKKFKEKQYDHIVYDILGDIVCGGFFEPLKKRKVQKMYIVTSGEFNSIFAASNLCNGYVNCSLAEKGVSLAGVIGNCRGVPNEENIIRSFCEKINLPLISVIPRDNRIEKCTIECSSVVETYENIELFDCFKKIAENICKDNEYHSINMLDLDDLRALYKGLL